MKHLKVFTQTPQNDSLTVTCDVRQKNQNIYEFDFNLYGDIEAIKWNEGSANSRTDNLWQTTCFEAFLSSENSNSDDYYEINCSPQGAWNSYYFERYRDGMKLSAVEVKLMEKKITPQAARFLISVTNPSPWNARFLGLSAVLEFKNGEKAYWALRHTGSEPNFHAKEAWDPLTTR